MNKNINTITLVIIAFASMPSEGATPLSRISALIKSGIKNTPTIENPRLRVLSSTVIDTVRSGTFDNIKGKCYYMAAGMVPFRYKIEFLTNYHIDKANQKLTLDAEGYYTITANSSTLNRPKPLGFSYTGSSTSIMGRIAHYLLTKLTHER